MKTYTPGLFCTETHTPNLHEGWEGLGSGPAAATAWLRALGRAAAPEPHLFTSTWAYRGLLHRDAAKSKWNDGKGFKSTPMRQVTLRKLRQQSRVPQLASGRDNTQDQNPGLQCPYVFHPCLHEAAHRHKVCKSWYFCDLVFARTLCNFTGHVTVFFQQKGISSER